MPLSDLLKAYVEGNSININNTTINFAGYNQSKFIAQFHGHLHNFLTSKIYNYSTGSGV
jgi:hypothetical protein